MPGYDATTDNSLPRRRRPNPPAAGLRRAGLPAADARHDAVAHRTRRAGGELREADDRDGRGDPRLSDASAGRACARCGLTPAPSRAQKSASAGASAFPAGAAAVNARPDSHRSSGSPCATSPACAPSRHRREARLRPLLMRIPLAGRLFDRRRRVTRRCGTSLRPCASPGCWRPSGRPGSSSARSLHAQDLFAPEWIAALETLQTTPAPALPGDPRAGRAEPRRPARELYDGSTNNRSAPPRSPRRTVRARRTATRWW